MHRIYVAFVMLAFLSACADQTAAPAPVPSGEAQAKPEPYKHPSNRMGLSDLPTRMPRRTEDFYGPASGCTAGRIAKGWC